MSEIDIQSNTDEKLTFQRDVSSNTQTTLVDQKKDEGLNFRDLKYISSQD